METDDWRLNGQEEYLQGVHLQWKSFELGYPGYEHEHCEFCWQMITCLDLPDTDRCGYATDDNHFWVCAKCFKDFQYSFEWKLD